MSRAVLFCSGRRRRQLLLMQTAFYFSPPQLRPGWRADKCSGDVSRWQTGNYSISYGCYLQTWRISLSLLVLHRTSLWGVTSKLFTLQISPPCLMFNCISLYISVFLCLFLPDWRINVLISRLLRKNMGMRRIEVPCMPRRGPACDFLKTFVLK